MEKNKEIDMISIFLSDVLAQKGGPSGYLFNLKKSIELNNEKSINIISQDYSPSDIHKKTKIVNFKKIIPHYIKQKIIEIKIIKMIKKRKNVFLNSKIIHFHTTRDLYIYCKNFNVEGKKIFLTSHSPELPYEELKKVLIAQKINDKKINKEIEAQKKYDLYAFRKADKIVFPCEGAVDPYRDFLFKNNIPKEKIDYVLTACEKLEFKLSKEEFFIKHDIPLNRKIIAFVGRHNEVKGFDIFCKIAEHFVSDNKYMFVCAGVGDIQAPVINNFKNIGWTDDPGALVNAASIIIVPNRETYFDIGILQYLSLGKIIITTKTGGNKWFLGKTEDILFADNNISSYIDYIKNNMDNEISEKNIELYNKYFRIKKFSENYMKLYSKYLQE